MGRTLTLDERHFKAAAERARELGETPERYIESLIDAATLSFDEILAPVRDAFRDSGTTEEELDEAVVQARKAIYDRAKRKPRK